MRLLLDTHVLLTIVDPQNFAIPRVILDRATDASTTPFVSIASLWEITIKYRLGKLTLSIAPVALPPQLQKARMRLVAVDERHVLHDVAPWPDTNDPFDRLLLATAAVEGARFLTVDAKLANHRLAWRPA